MLGRCASFIHAINDADAVPAGTSIGGAGQFDAPARPPVSLPLASANERGSIS